MGGESFGDWLVCCYDGGLVDVAEDAEEDGVVRRAGLFPNWMDRERERGDPEMLWQACSFLFAFLRSVRLLVRIE